MATMKRARQDGKKVSHHATSEAQPILGQRSKEIQPYGTLVHYPLALRKKVRKTSVEGLNQILADSLSLRDMYKKHHWQVSGPTFRQLHRLFDKHHTAQMALIDMLAERVQTLGGIAIAMPGMVVKATRIEEPPAGREQVPVQISRLLAAHEEILRKAHEVARQATANGDDGTADLLIADVIRTHEKQVWFLSEHLVDTPLVRAR